MKAPTLLCVFGGLAMSSLAGCAHRPAPIPTALTAAGNPVGGRQLLGECLQAHGGRSAYARLHDVNVRYEGHWAAVGPRLQPKLSDTGFRGGSEERYLPAANGFVVGQHHHGPKGEKRVFRSPANADPEVAYRAAGDPGGPTVGSSDPEVLAAAALVTDAYAMFLFGPYFFEKRGAYVQKLDATTVVAGRLCDEVLAILRPGLGKTPEDRVVLCIDRADRLLREVRFTLNGLESTQGAEVHVELMAQRRMDGVLWPTEFYEHIDRPVNLPAHRWTMTGFDTGRGYGASDLVAGDETGFKGRAAHPARDFGSAR